MRRNCRHEVPRSESVLRPRDVGKCQTPDAEGVCRVKTQMCTMDYTPVCGCDGVTYANACGATAAGVSVDHAGECKPA